MKYVIISVCILLLVPMVLGDVRVGNPGFSIVPSYGQGDLVRGWVNISLEDVSIASLVEGFGQNRTLKTWLERGDEPYVCTPLDCQEGYVLSGNPTPSVTTALSHAHTGLLGIVLTDDISSVDSFSFNVATNAGASCVPPLRIDVLDDGDEEWHATGQGIAYGCALSNRYGCFNASDAQQKTDITTESYCEQIGLLEGSRQFTVGADVLRKTGTGNVAFTFQMDVAQYSETCTVSTSTSGSVNCSVILDEALIEDSTAEVCVNLVNSGDSGKFEIAFEDVSPCGYAGGFEHDFPIFVSPGKYASVSNVSFDQSKVMNGADIADDIYWYIQNEYGGNCSEGCVIPIAIHGGTSQTITIDNVSLGYARQGLPQYVTRIARANRTAATVTSGFIALDLSDTGISVPNTTGTKTFALSLDDESLFSTSIQITSAPRITSVSPGTIPALVTVLLSAHTDSLGNNLTYRWDFGDGNTKTTKENTTQHRYSDVGEYTLTVTLSKGNTSSQYTRTLSVVSPKNHINTTLTKYSSYLSQIRTEIAAAPSWTQDTLKREVPVDDLESSVQGYRTQYAAASTTNEYVSIMQGLIDLNVPERLSTGTVIREGTYIQDPAQLDFQTLESLGAGTYSGDRSAYQAVLQQWLLENVDVSFSSRTYTLAFEDSYRPVFSHVTMTITPKKSIPSLYVVVNGNPPDVRFKDQTPSAVSSASGLLLSLSEEPVTIEFLHPSAIHPVALPVYMTPPVSSISANALQPGICNYNAQCERGRGENNGNCPNDCRPYGSALLWILGVLFIALLVYIVLQEWYKRRYQSYLFPSRNDLFNLLQYMRTAEQQNMKRDAIFGKLKQYSWSGEQLQFAWRRLHGKRTGMWEIPLFTWAERNYVHKELDKRAAQGRVPQNSNINK